MKITKFHQSCILIETKGRRILIDPGNIEYQEELLEKGWNQITDLFITHRHPDHCLIEAIEKIQNKDQCKIYTSKEVLDFHLFENAKQVKSGDKIELGNGITVEVTKAVHGFLTAMKYTNKEIKENIGFIIDDGENRIYLTSDTINFNHDYHADILCMPFNGNGLTMGITDGIDFAKDIAPSLVIPVHLEHKLYNPEPEELKKALDEAGLEYEILDPGEFVEVE